MTPLAGVLLILFIAALIVIVILVSPQRKEEVKRQAAIKSKGKGYRAFMSDRECQVEYDAHKPSVSAAVMNKLNSMKRKYIEAEGILKFQDCAGVYLDHGYSIRYRIKEGENYRLVCHSYNTSGKFYSTQDTK